MEIWKTIEDFPNYEVSNFGNVRNSSKNKLMTVSLRKNGYCVVKLSFNGISKECRVHRLVAKTFIDNPNNLPHVNHKDEDKTNNNVWNLEWCDRKYNMNYGTARERMAHKFGKEVRCVETGITYWSSKEAERQTGIWATHIREACKNPKRTAGGYHWEDII